MVSPESAPAVPDEGTQLLQELVGSESDDKAQEPEEPEVQIDPDTIQSRLEDLLSKQNLSEDAFIQQHMNAQMYIPLAILCRHHNLRALGDEASVLSAAKAAAQRSEKIGVDDDGAMVRPLLKARRNTLILHGLPDTFPEEELQDLFNGSPEGESFLSLKPDVNNTAFVSFKTDEAAQNAALWLRSQKLQGAEIKCAVKSEHFVRSFYPAAAGPSMQANSPYMMPGSPAYQAWGYPWMPANMGWQGEHFADPNAGNMGWGDQSQLGWPQDGSSGTFQGKGDGKSKSPKGKGKGRKRGSLGGSFCQSDGSLSQMESGSDFNSPMLGAAGPAETAIEGLPEPGYTHEYRKYSRQYIIEVCNAMDEIVKPESYDKCEHGENGVALFRSSPCKDWAPLPTPMVTFASSFFDDKRGSVDSLAMDGDGPGKGDRGDRKGDRKASWGPDSAKRHSTESYMTHEESDWSHGDSSWGKGGAGKGRPQRASWGGGKGEKPYGAWQSDGAWDGGYGQQQQQPQWVKKEDKAKQEQEATEWDDSGPRKMSWADKVKGVEPSDRPQKWVAKAKPNEEAKNKDEEGDPNSAPDAAAATPSEEAAPGKAASMAAATPAQAAPQTTPAEAAPQAAPADTAPATEAAAASPTWADKARAANNKK